MKCFCLFLLVWLSLGLEAREWRFPLGAAKTEFGSGSIALSAYSPGGIPGVGCFAGHPNLLTRKDRILLRFDISDCYLSGRTPEITGAWLEFTLWFVAGAQNGRTVRLEHLDYEPNHFTSEDLSNPAATATGNAPVVLKKHPPENNDGRYRFEVTDVLRNDLAAVRQYAAFRVSDSCESQSNKTGGAIGLLLQMPNLGRGAIPVLIVETRDGEKVAK